jgi:hypothetical protein
MTQDEIIEMARQADDEADKVLNMKGEYHPNWHDVRDEIFAKLVAEREREACAKVCEDKCSGQSLIYVMAMADCAEAIRARGQE